MNDLLAAAIEEIEQALDLANSRQPGEVTVREYAEYKNISPARAWKRLRDGVQDGRLCCRSITLNGHATMVYCPVGDADAD